MKRICEIRVFGSLPCSQQLGAPGYWPWSPHSGRILLRWPLFSLQLKELYTLLNENYVEDDDNMFRFDYSPEFLLWWVVRTFLWFWGHRAEKQGTRLLIPPKCQPFNGKSVCGFWDLLPVELRIETLFKAQWLGEKFLDGIGTQKKKSSVV